MLWYSIRMSSTTNECSLNPLSGSCRPSPNPQSCKGTVESTTQIRPPVRTAVTRTKWSKVELKRSASRWMRRTRKTRVMTQWATGTLIGKTLPKADIIVKKNQIKTATVNKKKYLVYNQSTLFPLLTKTASVLYRPIILLMSLLRGLKWFPHVGIVTEQVG